MFCLFFKSNTHRHKQTQTDTNTHRHTKHTHVTHPHPLPHSIGVETGQIALLHFSRKFPEIYRMGGEIGTRIRADLWGLASGAVVEKYQVESVKGKNYYKSLSDKAADGRSVPKHVAAQVR